VQSSSPDWSTPGHENEHLSKLELHRLTLYKWRYTLESLGFVGSQVNELMFLRWLRATARVPG
jgi:hypothetical protein